MGGGAGAGLDEGAMGRPKQEAEDAAGALLALLRDRTAKNGRQGLMYSIGDLLNDRDGLVLCTAQTQDALLAETVARAEAAAALEEAAFAWELVERFPADALRRGSASVLRAAGQALAPALPRRAGVGAPQGNFRLPRSGWSSNSVLEGAAQVLSRMAVGGGAPGADPLPVECLQHAILWVKPACSALLRDVPDASHGHLRSCLDMFAAKWRARDPAALLDYGWDVPGLKALEDDLIGELDTVLVPRLAQLLSCGPAQAQRGVLSWGVFATLFGRGLSDVNVRIANKFLKAVQGVLQTKDAPELRRASLCAWGRLVSALEPSNLTTKWVSLLVTPFLMGHLPALCDPDASVQEVAVTQWSRLLGAIPLKLLRTPVKSGSGKTLPGTIWDMVALRCIRMLVEGRGNAAPAQGCPMRPAHADRGFAQITLVFERGWSEIRSSEGDSFCTPSNSEPPLHGPASVTQPSRCSSDQFGPEGLEWLMSQAPLVLASMLKAQSTLTETNALVQSGLSGLWLALVKFVGETASREPVGVPSARTLDAVGSIFELLEEKFSGLVAALTGSATDPVHQTYAIDSCRDFLSAFTQFPVFSSLPFITAYVLSKVPDIYDKDSPRPRGRLSRYPLFTFAKRLLSVSRAHKSALSVTEDILQDILLSLNCPTGSAAVSLTFTEFARLCATFLIGSDFVGRRQFSLRQHDLGLETGDVDFLVWSLLTKVVQEHLSFLADEASASQAEMEMDAQVALCSELCKMLLIPLELSYSDGVCLAENSRGGARKPRTTVTGLKARGTWKALFASMSSLAGLHSGRFLQGIARDLVARLTAMSPSRRHAELVLAADMPNCVYTELLVSACSAILSNIPAAELNDYSVEGGGGEDPCGAPGGSLEHSQQQRDLPAVLLLLQNTLDWVLDYAEVDSRVSKSHAAVLLQSLETLCKRINQKEPAIVVLQFPAQSLGRFLAAAKGPFNLHSAWYAMIQMWQRAKVPINDRVLHYMGPVLHSSFESCNLATVNRTIVFWNTAIAPALSADAVTYPPCLYTSLSKLSAKGDISLPGWEKIKDRIPEPEQNPRGDPWDGLGALPSKISDLFSPGKSRQTAPRAKPPAGLQNEEIRPQGTEPKSELAAAKRPSDQPPDGAAPDKIQKRGQISGSCAPSLADAQDLEVTQANRRKRSESVDLSGLGGEAALDALRRVDWGALSHTQLAGTQVALLQVAHDVALAIRSKSLSE